MKLTIKQVQDLHCITNMLLKMLDQERADNHAGWEPENDTVYNEIDAAIGSIQCAIENNE